MVFLMDTTWHHLGITWTTFGHHLGQFGHNFGITLRQFCTNFGIILTQPLHKQCQDILDCWDIIRIILRQLWDHNEITSRQRTLIHLWHNLGKLGNNFDKTLRQLGNKLWATFGQLWDNFGTSWWLFIDYWWGVPLLCGHHMAIPTIL